MKSMIVVALALVAVAAAIPVESEPVVITRSTFDQQPDGPYQSAFETSDGTSRQEEAVWKDVVNEEGKTVKVLAIRGQYTYVNKEGNKDTVTYVADEAGYRADGPSVPKAARR